MKRIFCLSIVIMIAGSLVAQNALSFRIITLSAHPWAQNNLPLHQNKIDNNGYMTFEPGLIIAYDRHIKKRFSINLSTAVFNDCYNSLAGYSQIMLKYNVFKIFKHSLNVGFGPSVHYETDKRNTYGYENEDQLQFIDNTGYKISWLSGTLEYNYLWSKAVGFSVALNHIHPRSLAISLGLRFDIPDPNGKGCNCPGYR